MNCHIYVADTLNRRCQHNVAVALNKRKSKQKSRNELRTYITGNFKSSAFKPTTTKNLDRTTATRSMVTGAKCARYDKLVSAPGDGGSVDDPNDKPGGGSDGGDDGEAPDPTV